MLAIPPGGGEEDAQLFAVCVDRRSQGMAPGGLFQSGPRPAALPYEGHVLSPIDPDVVPRLFERGHHPGDFVVGAYAPQPDLRPSRAVLSILDLSVGLSGFDRLSLPPENRYALAEAFAALGGAWWKAADLLDRASLVRSGAVAPLGGNPLTAEAHHRHMLELGHASNAAGGVDRHPIVDFRSLSTAELAHEIRMDGRAAASARPDLRRDGAGIDLLLSWLRGLFDDVEAEAVTADAVSRMLRRRDEVLAEAEPAILQLASGQGPGALCWRNLFAEHGLIATVDHRLFSPGCDDELIGAVSRLPAWAREPFRNPAVILRRRLDRLDQVPRILDDRYRPHFALHERRISASPGLVAALDGERLRVVLDGTRQLIAAFDTIDTVTPTPGRPVTPWRSAGALLHASTFGVGRGSSPSRRTIQAFPKARSSSPMRPPSICSPCPHRRRRCIGLRAGSGMVPARARPSGVGPGPAALRRRAASVRRRSGDRSRVP